MGFNWDHIKKKKIFFRTSSFVLTGIIYMLFLTACDPNRAFEENKEVPGHIWKMEDVIQFKVPVQDTISSHSIFINLRNYSEYPYSNIYLFVHVTSPAGDALTDTVNFILADQKGKWLGRGLGDMYFSRLLYKQNIRFPYPGIYIFDITQGMRTNLKGIRDVGLRVERLKTNAGGKK